MNSEHFKKYKSISWLTCAYRLLVSHDQARSLANMLCFLSTVAFLIGYKYRIVKTFVNYTCIAALHLVRNAEQQRLLPCIRV